MEGLAVPIENLAKGIKGVQDAIAEKIQGVQDAIVGKIISIYDKIIEVRDGILSIPETIAEKFKELLNLLFVPSEEFMNEKFTPITDKFSFVWDIKDFVFEMVDTIMVSSETPPTITVHLAGVAGGRYGSQDVTIDFKWYEPYKPVGDALLSGMLFLCYAWNAFMHLPSVFNGASSSASVATSIAKE